MTETDITQALIAHFKGLGGDAWHVHGNKMQRSGEPDIDGWIPSDMGAIPLKIEVKTPIGLPTELQVIRLRRYHKSGAYLAGIATSIHDFDLLLQAYLRSLDELRDMWGVMQELGLKDPYYIYHDKGALEHEPIYR